MAGTTATITGRTYNGTCSATPGEYDALTLPIGTASVVVDAYGAAIVVSDGAETGGTMTTTARRTVPANSARRFAVNGMNKLFIASATAAATYSIHAELK